MARIRTIKPEFYTDEELSSLPEVTHLFAGGLLTYADDEGYFNANPGLIKAALLPLREPSVSVPEMLTQLSRIDYVRFGKGFDGKCYGHVVKFSVHQRVNRPTPSKIKCLCISWEDSLKPHAQLGEPSPPEWNREQGKEREGEPARAREDAPRETGEVIECGSGLCDSSQGIAERILGDIRGTWRESFPDCHAPNFERWLADLESRGKHLTDAQRLLHARRLSQQGNADDQLAVVDFSIEVGSFTLIPIVDVRRRTQGTAAIGKGAPTGNDSMRRLIDRRSSHPAWKDFRDPRGGETADEYRRAQDEAWNAYMRKHDHASTQLRQST